MNIFIKKIFEGFSGPLYLLGLVLFILTFGSLLTNHQGFALRLINYGYFFLGLGTLFYIFQNYRNEKD